MSKTTTIKQKNGWYLIINYSLILNKKKSLLWLENLKMVTALFQ